VTAAGVSEPGTVLAENFCGPGPWKASTVERQKIQCVTTKGQLALRDVNEACTRKTWQYNHELKQSTHRKTSVSVAKLVWGAGRKLGGTLSLEPRLVRGQ